MSPIKTMSAFGVFLSLLIGTGRAAADQEDRYLTATAGQLRVVVAEKASPPELRAAAMFAREVRRRTGLDVPVATGTGGAPAKYSLYLGTKDTSAWLGADKARDEAIAGLGEDGFYLSCTPDAAGRLFVIGANPGNVVAGVGKLLRMSRYADGSLRLPRQTLKDRPGMPVRGIYFATHFFNFYHAAPVEEVDPIIEECALWGLNQLVVWFDMHHFASLDTPDAQKHLERLKHFQKMFSFCNIEFQPYFNFIIENLLQEFNTKVLVLYLLYILQKFFGEQ